MSETKSDAQYTMGRSKEEEDRLIQQSQLYDAVTRRMLHSAGLAGGMKVLDIGSGTGDVAMTAAELVGPEGSVVGVDMNPEILETARARAGQAGFANIEFVAGDARTLDLGDDFDALIGRLVLMYTWPIPPTPSGSSRRAWPPGESSPSRRSTSAPTGIPATTTRR